MNARVTAAHESGLHTQRTLTPMPPTRTFHPRWNRTLALGSGSLALIGLAGGLRAALDADGSARAAALVVGSLGVAAAGLWLARGMSWPWSGPAVVLSDVGLALWPRRRRARVIPWSEVASVRLDGTNRRTLFDLVDAAAHEARLGPFRSPPHCPSDLWNAAGEDFHIVLDEYWRTPT